MIMVSRNWQFKYLPPNIILIYFICKWEKEQWFRYIQVSAETNNPEHTSPDNIRTNPHLSVIEGALIEAAITHHVICPMAHYPNIHRLISDAFH